MVIPLSQEPSHFQIGNFTFLRSYIPNKSTKHCIVFMVRLINKLKWFYNLRYRRVVTC